jgi:hypothetical protein
MNGIPYSTWQKNDSESVYDFPSANIPICNITNKVLFAYSLRLVNANYTGAIIKIRRSRDNAELDIYPNQFGMLDLVTMQNFCPTGNGFITTWYDQSGNAYNLTQSTAGSQPQIITNGILETINGNPTVNLLTNRTLSYPTTAFDWNDGYSALCCINFINNSTTVGADMTPLNLLSSINTGISLSFTETNISLNFPASSNLNFFGQNIKNLPRIFYAQWGKTITPYVDTFGIGCRTRVINTNSFTSTSFTVGRSSENSTGSRKINELYLFNGNMIPDFPNTILNRKTNTQYEETFLNILKNVAKYNSIGLPI